MILASLFSVYLFSVTAAAIPVLVEQAYSTDYFVLVSVELTAGTYN